MKRRYTVIEAAKVLGVGTDAVRKRVARGTVEHEKVDDTVFVWLDNGQDDGTTKRHDDGTTKRHDSGAELFEAYRDQLAAYKDQVGYLRSQLDQERRANDENRRLLAALIQRVPELEAGADSSAPSKTSQETSQDSVNGTTRVPAGGEDVQSGPERSSWWRRVFGG